ASPVTARSSCPCRTAVDSSLTGHAPFSPADECCAPVYPNQEEVFRKNRRWRYPSGRLPPGGGVRGQSGDPSRPSPEPRHRRDGPVRRPVALFKPLARLEKAMSFPCDLPTAEEVFHACAPRVYSVAWRMLGNEADAEDVTQDVLLQVVRKLD